MNIKNQILHYTPADKKEEQAKKSMLDALETDIEDVFNRENIEFHFTTSGFIMDQALVQTLMVHHNIYQSFSWTGGHADGEQDLLAVAIREANEETGIKEMYPFSNRILSLDVLEVPAHSKAGITVAPHRHYNVAYGLIASTKQPLIVKEDENSAVKWIPVDQIDEECNEQHMMGIYHKIYNKMTVLQQEKNLRYQKVPEVFLKWYGENARVLPWRTDKDPYHIWLSEIMLQQTRVEAVKSYYTRFLAVLPTIESLAVVDIDKLFKLWEGLGYYNRARNLQKAAVVIMEKYNGVFPENDEDILALPGIGDYTAGAIASICFNQPTPAVDGNVLRVISRITEDFESIDKPVMKKRISASLKEVYPTSHASEFTQSLMEIGAMVCVPNGAPKCEECPAVQFCMAHENGTTALLPSKMKKKKRKIEEKTVFVLSCNDKVAIRQRNEKGLLSGLWELPNVPKMELKEALSLVAEMNVAPVSIDKEINKNHIFTHIEWRMTCYYLKCNKQSEEFIWASKEQLSQEFALPTAFRQFL